MELSRKEQETSHQAVEYVKAHKRQLVERMVNLEKSAPPEDPLAIFMAGSPGAGKTEFSQRLLPLLEHESQRNIIAIDPDQIRTWMLGYGGGNDHLFQKAVTRVVNEVFSSVIKSQQDFLLDGTLAKFDIARQNIERALRRGYSVMIVYVYQDPVSAWKFTQAREIDEGRRIRKETFINQYFSARLTVNDLKKYFQDDITVALVVKDFLHNIKQFESDIDSIDDYLKVQYTPDIIEKILK